MKNKKKEKKLMKNNSLFSIIHSQNQYILYVVVAVDVLWDNSHFFSLVWTKNFYIFTSHGSIELDFLFFCRNSRNEIFIVYRGQVIFFVSIVIHYRKVIHQSLLSSSLYERRNEKRPLTNGNTILDSSMYIC